MLVRESADYQRDRKTPTLLEFQSQDYFDKMASPRILSTHLRFHHIPDDMKKRKCKIIYIQRNPKDVAVSFRHYIKSEVDVDIPWDDYVNAFVNADEGNFFTVFGQIFLLDIVFSFLQKRPYSTRDIQQLSYRKTFFLIKKNHILSAFVLNKLLYNIQIIQSLEITDLLMTKCLNPFDEITRMAKFLGVSTDREFINEVVKKTQFTDMKNAKLEFVSQTDVLQRRKEYYRKGVLKFAINPVLLYDIPRLDSKFIGDISLIF
ncbi:hypothetical protein KUTeg_013199 [Tegillarca granosa]|uniref:Sulfotransferase domain-containing protein n=1 Tax=Tegillarca granosa TaxID=220873 RepID=A0ABQ9EY58_TEGGR|nr:hypothetical protein KUTeg_013199 [Tegillarca granosa]